MSWLFFCWLFGSWIAGIVVGAFAIQILIILRFGLPYAVRLKGDGLLLDNRPVVRMVLSLIVVTILSGLAMAAAWWWLDQWAKIMTAGFVFSWLLGWKKTNHDPINVEEFLRKNAASIDIKLWRMLTTPGMPPNLVALAKIVIPAFEIVEAVAVDSVVEDVMHELANDPGIRAKYFAEHIDGLCDKLGDVELAEIARRPGITIPELHSEIARRYGQEEPAGGAKLGTAMALTGDQFKLAIIEIFRQRGERELADSIAYGNWSERQIREILRGKYGPEA